MLDVECACSVLQRAKICYIHLVGIHIGVRLDMYGITDRVDGGVLHNLIRIAAGVAFPYSRATAAPWKTELLASSPSVGFRFEVSSITNGRTLARIRSFVRPMF